MSSYYKLEHHEFFRDCEANGLTYEQMADLFVEVFPESERSPNAGSIKQYFLHKSPEERIALAMMNKRLSTADICDDWTAVTHEILRREPKRPKREKVKHETKVLKEVPHGYIW